MSKVRRLWQTIVQHRILAVLFAAYWLVAFGVCARQVSTGDGQASGYILQILVPVVAGGLIAFGGGRMKAAFICGAVIGFLDFELLVKINQLYRHPSAKSNVAAIIVLLSVSIIGGAGGALGIIGALVGQRFRKDPMLSIRLSG